MMTHELLESVIQQFLYVKLFPFAIFEIRVTENGPDFREEMKGRKAAEKPESTPQT